MEDKNITNTIKVVAENPSNGASIYASEQTNTALGWITTEISEIAPIDILVLSREDIFDPNLPDVFNKQPFLSAMLLHPESDAITKTFENLTEAFRATGADDYEFGVTELSILNQLGINGAAVVMMDMDQDNQNDLAVIVTPDLDEAPEYYVGQLAGIPQENLENIPGAGSDYVAFILLHEKAHITHINERANEGTSKSVLFSEVNADAEAARQVYEAIDAGHGLDQQIIETIAAARIMGGLRNFSPYEDILNVDDNHSANHNTGQLVNWENGLPQINGNEALFEAEVQVSFLVNCALGTLELHKNGEVTGNNLSPLETGKHGAYYGIDNPGSALSILDILSEKGYLSDIEGSEAYHQRITQFVQSYAPELYQAESYTTIQDYLVDFPHADIWYKNALADQCTTEPEQLSDMIQFRDANSPVVGQ